MMRCIIIDDEKLALDLLEDNVRQVPFLQLAKRCRNAMEAIEVLQSEKIDLIFLDIQMPGLSGLQFLQTLVNPPMAILITAYEKYALEGYNLDVVDYLLKPVSFDRFLKACHKAKARFDLQQEKDQPLKPATDFMFVHVEYNHVKVAFAEILYIEGLKDYIRIHLVHSSKPVLTRMSLKAIEEKLPDGQFIRTHKSYIVSVSKIATITRDTVLLGQVEIPLSEFYKENLAKILGNK